MTLWVSLIVISASLPGIAFLLLRGNSTKIRTAEDIIGRIQPLDLAAFRNLVDPLEEAYLRERLSLADFVPLRRARLLAAAEYVRVAAANAALLLRLGDAARQSPDTTIAEAGRVLAENALRVRLSAGLALAKIYGGILIPGAAVSIGAMVDAYGEVTGSAGRLGRIQQPARTSAIYSAL